MIRHRRPLRHRLLAAALLLATALPSPAYALRPEIEGTVQPGLETTLRRRGSSVGLEETISPALRKRLQQKLDTPQVHRAVGFITSQFQPPPSPYQAGVIRFWFESAAPPGEPPVRLGAVAKILSNRQHFDEEAAKAFLIAARLWAKHGLMDNARDALINHLYWPQHASAESTISWIRQTADPGAFRPDAEAQLILQEAYAMRDRPALGSVEAERAAAQRRDAGLEEQEEKSLVTILRGGLAHGSSNETLEREIVSELAGLRQSEIRRWRDPIGLRWMVSSFFDPERQRDRRSTLQDPERTAGQLAEELWRSEAEMLRGSPHMPPLPAEVVPKLQEALNWLAHEELPDHLGDIEWIHLFGSYDRQSAEAAADLYHQVKAVSGKGPTILVSGHMGRLSGNLEGPEWEFFSGVLKDRHVSKDDILYEKAATNTGESVVFTLRGLMREGGRHPRAVALVMFPPNQMRALATYHRELESSAANEHISYRYPWAPTGEAVRVYSHTYRPNVHELNPVEQWRMLRIVTGELQRLEDYPRWKTALQPQGLCETTSIPASVLALKQALDHDLRQGPWAGLEGRRGIPVSAPAAGLEEIPVEWPLDPEADAQAQTFAAQGYFLPSQIRHGVLEVLQGPESREWFADIVSALFGRPIVPAQIAQVRPVGAAGGHHEAGILQLEITLMDGDRRPLGVMFPVKPELDHTVQAQVAYTQRVHAQDPSRVPRVYGVAQSPSLGHLTALQWLPDATAIYPSLGLDDAFDLVPPDPPHFLKTVHGEEAHAVRRAIVALLTHLYLALGGAMADGVELGRGDAVQTPEDHWWLTIVRGVRDVTPLQFLESLASLTAHVQGTTGLFDLEDEESSQRVDKVVGVFQEEDLRVGVAQALAMRRESGQAGSLDDSLYTALEHFLSKAAPPPNGTGFPTTQGGLEEKISPAMQVIQAFLTGWAENHRDLHPEVQSFKGGRALKLTVKAPVLGQGQPRHLVAAGELSLLVEERGRATFDVVLRLAEHGENLAIVAQGSRLTVEDAKLRISRMLDLPGSQMALTAWRPTKQAAPPASPDPRGGLEEGHWKPAVPVGEPDTRGRQYIEWQQLPSRTQAVLSLLNRPELRGKLFVIGGFVRDLLLGHPSFKDVDLIVAKDAPAGYLTAFAKHLFGESFESVNESKRLYVVRVDGEEMRFEFLSAVVDPSSGIPEPAAPEFTFNRLLLGFDERGELYLLDPYGGFDDLFPRHGPRHGRFMGELPQHMPTLYAKKLLNRFLRFAQDQELALTMTSESVARATEVASWLQDAFSNGSSLTRDLLGNVLSDFEQWRSLQDATGLEEEATGHVGFVLTGQTAQAWGAFAEQGLEFLAVADPARAAELRASGLEEAHLLVVERGVAWPEALAHARARLNTAGVETIRVLTDGNLVLRITEALRGARWPAEAIDRFLEQVRITIYT